jgi:hypothetical protein
MYTKLYNESDNERSNKFIVFNKQVYTEKQKKSNNTKSYALEERDWSLAVKWH